ncbi:MAG: DUF6119 family protein [Flavobacterium sp.]
MSEKIQNNVYLLKDTKKEFKKSLIVEEKIDFLYLKTLFKKKGFKEQILLPDLSQKYDIKVYYKKASTPIKWKDFISKVVEPNQDILKLSFSTSESYVIVFYNPVSMQYFASTGGYAHVLVQEIATNDFGLEILSRILKADDKTLRSSKERNLTGGIQGAIKFFRNDYNLYENESFGNIYNELNASISKDQLVKIFGFTKTDLKLDSLCIAKNSFSLKKSISFIELLNVIERCENLIKLPPIVEINSVEKISKSNVGLLHDLWKVLNQKIYDNYLDENKFFSVEISHKDFEKYYYANSTTVTVSTKLLNGKFDFEEGIRNVQTILDEIRIKNPSLKCEEFEKCIDSGNIETFDENGQTITKDSFKNHFCTEISLASKSYFLIEKDWYEIGKTLIDKINEQAEHFIVNNKYSGPSMSKWVNGSENEYNSTYFVVNNSLVFDKFTPQNIEACDVMRWDSTKVYFYHVKKGFNNSMRDLCNQVLIAARKVQEDSKNGYSFLEVLYDVVVENKGKTPYSIDAKNYLARVSKIDFIDLVKNRTLVFVLAVLDDSAGSRKMEIDIDKFDSNIAKFSLSELSKSMRNLEVEFQILQLEK